MSELYRKYEGGLARDDWYERDEQAERDRDLGRAVREELANAAMCSAQVARCYGCMKVLQHDWSWAHQLYEAIADALEAEEAANAATGH